MKHLSALRKYFWKYRLRLGVGIFFIVISNYFSVLAPQVTGFIIRYTHEVIQPGASANNAPLQRPSYDISVQAFIKWIQTLGYGPIQVVILCGFTILALALLRGLFMFMMRQTIIVMSRHIEYDQKEEVYKHYQALDATFYKTQSTGDLMSRMAEDVSRVRMFTGPAVMYLINLITLISLSVFFMIKRDPELTLYVLAPLPILAIIIYYVNTIIHRKSESLQASLAQVTINAQQSYSGIRVIKSFVQEGAMFRHFEKGAEKYREQAVSLAKVEALYFPTMTLLIGLSTLLTIMIGGIYYIRGEQGMGIDTLVEFVIYINMLTFPVSAIGWTASMIQRASASQKRLNEFLHTEPGIKGEGGMEPELIKGDIRFENVDFVYSHTGIRAIKDFNLHIKEGERIAIVGRTGSGKTTVAQLILRMFDPGSGRILVDGSDIKSINLKNLRNNISYVPQDGFLFSDSIAANIAFGKEEGAREKIRQAARLAVVEKDIDSFPNGFDTLVGERGVTLSGGQKQRVSIARALMKDAPVIILDDCLSAVDARTEREIIGNLRQALEGRTSILITHRIFSLFQFDQVLVLEEGKIVEKGTHEELLAKGGIYFQMYQRQLREDSTEADSTNLAVDKT